MTTRREETKVKVHCDKNIEFEVEKQSIFQDLVSDIEKQLEARNIKQDLIKISYFEDQEKFPIMDQDDYAIFFESQNIDLYIEKELKVIVYNKNKQEDPLVFTIENEVNVLFKKLEEYRFPDAVFFFKANSQKHLCLPQQCLQEFCLDLTMKKPDIVYIDNLIQVEDKVSSSSQFFLLNDDKLTFEKLTKTFALKKKSETFMYHDENNSPFKIEDEDDFVEFLSQVEIPKLIYAKENEERKPIDTIEKNRNKIGEEFIEDITGKKLTIGKDLDKSDTFSDFEEDMDSTIKLGDADDLKSQMQMHIFYFRDLISYQTIKANIEEISSNNIYMDIKKEDIISIFDHKSKKLSAFSGRDQLLHELKSLGQKEITIFIAESRYHKENIDNDFKRSKYNETLEMTLNSLSNLSSHEKDAFVILLNQKFKSIKNEKNKNRLSRSMELANTEYFNVKLSLTELDSEQDQLLFDSTMKIQLEKEVHYIDLSDRYKSPDDLLLLFEYQIDFNDHSEEKDKIYYYFKHNENIVYLHNKGDIRFILKLQPLYLDQKSYNNYKQIFVCLYFFNKDLKLQSKIISAENLKKVNNEISRTAQELKYKDFYIGYYSNDKFVFIKTDSVFKDYLKNYQEHFPLLLFNDYVEERELNIAVQSN